MWVSSLSCKPAILLIKSSPVAKLPGFPKWELSDFQNGFHKKQYFYCSSRLQFYGWLSLWQVLPLFRKTSGLWQHFYLRTETEWSLLPLVHSALLGLSSGDKTSPPLTIYEPSQMQDAPKKFRQADLAKKKEEKKGWRLIVSGTWTSRPLVRAGR